jgi:hypothetical protein
MSGSIIRTTTGYSLQIRITRNADKSVVAMHSETSSFTELDNLTAIRRASLDLLEKMGIRPTGRTRTELTRAAPASHVDAQSALARGLAAQRQGLEITAMSFFQQALELEPTLIEAESHLNVVTASVTRNIGADARGDIQWRNQWIARLREAEEFPAYFRRISPPFYLVYTTTLEQGNIDYVRETVNLSIDVYSLPEPLWFEAVNRLTRTVRNGLLATGRADAWNLNWPAHTLSSPSPFAGTNTSYAVVVELINANGRSIGRQTVTLPFDWFSPVGGVERGLIAPRSQFSPIKATFSGVDVNNVDNLSVRITSINGISAENTASQLGIRILPESQFNNIQSIRDNGLRTDNLRLFDIHFANQNSNRVNAYRGGTSVAIPYGVTLLDDRSGFQGRGLVSVNMPPTITRLERGINQSSTFGGNNLSSVIIPDSVTFIGQATFRENPLTRITIGENVQLEGGLWASLPSGMDRFYINSGRRAGTYTHAGGNNWNFTAAAR